MSRFTHRALTGARLLLAAFCWVTAAYAFVASSAFADLQFLKPRVFVWVGVFSDWHAVAVWAWIALAVAVLLPDLRRAGAPRRLAVGLLTLCAAAGAWNSLHPVLPGLVSGYRSVLMGLLALVPIIWLALIDHVDSAAFLRRQGFGATEESVRAFERHVFVAAIASALFIVALYAGLTSVSLMGAFEPDLMTSGLAIGFGWSLVDHLWIACAVFLLTAALGRLTRGRFLLQYAILSVLFSALFWSALLRFVADSIGLDENAGALAAAAVAVSLTGTWSGLRLRCLGREGDVCASAIDLYFGRARPRTGGTRAALSLLMVASLAYAGAAVAGRVDWDFALLKCGVLGVWMTMFGVVYRIESERLRPGTWTIVLVSLVPLIVHEAAPARFAQRHVLERYAVHNPSFRLADGLLHNVPSTPSFEKYLRANTPLPGEVPPVDIDFVRDLGPSPLASKPFIFLFVIDSLRPDYLGSYNPRVRFTPRLDQFASESAVFRNAFTSYGGTALSVPAMWAGSVIAHKQYVQPFHPMNALEKLLDANGYRRFLSLDHIMGQLLQRSDRIDELDRGIETRDYQLCRTLEELDSKLASGGSLIPAFAYSLPQDVHMSRLPRKIETGDEYRSFNAAYATKVHSIDACFGRFIDSLKHRGLYDRSLIVVTADHGEMLGEDGRFGHSYYLFPQVIRVPLIVHLPSALRGAAAVDPDAVTLTTDITPTLYAALGYAPVRSNELMGRPFIGTTDRSSTERRRDTYVLAASYGAVYAVLGHNGRRLFIADAVKGGDTAYERDSSGQWIEKEVTEGLRAIRQFTIRQHIDQIARIYHVSPRR